MTPEQLKASILQLAIQGRLVPQRPEEGTAEDLYREIQREKKKLIAAGQIKKQKPLPPIDASEVPFDIPETWKWVRLGSITLNLDSRRVPLSVSERDKLAKVYDYYGASGVIDKVDAYLFDKPLLLIGEDGANLLNRTKPIAFIATGKYWVNNHAHVLDVGQHVHMEYLELFINAIPLRQYVTGTAQPKMNQDRMNSIPVSLPPLAEQRRIVERYKMLLPLIERYGESYTALETLDKRFPEDMRKSILQYAIQGKLVPQRPEEGTAEDLCKQIQQEKKKLIAAGKIRKEKPLPPIKEEEIPFDIPETWKWVHMGEIFMHNTGKAQNATAETPNGVIRKYITTSNVYWNRFDFSSVKQMLFSEKEIQKCSVQKGDLLVCEGGDCGRAAIWEMDESVCIQNHVHRLRPYVKMEMKYFYYVFFFLKHCGYINGRGVGIKGLSSNALHVLPCPLPPVSEQKRIVDGIQNLTIRLK